jgi:hypothetical protein
VWLDSPDRDHLTEDLPFAWMSRLPEATAGLGDLVGRPMETHSKVLVDEAEEYECVGF